MNEYENKYRMSREAKQMMQGHMNRMDEEMSMLAKRFKLTNSSDIINMHQNYMLWIIAKNGLEVYGNTGGC